MDGPGGNLPRRRAGDSNSPQNPSPIRDWQRNTWYGPVPQDTNPFEEPDEAPELLELRSDNVRQKSGDFWQEQTGYISQNRISEKTKGKSKHAKKKNEWKLSRMLGKAILASLILMIGTGLVLFFGVYRVRNIQVAGSSRISADDIISLSGIRKGDSILTLDEKNISEKLISGARRKAKETGNQTYYELQFRYLERQMPNTVVISVREREPVCWVNLRGIYYVLDRDRMILWETENKDETPKKMVLVKGLEDKTGARAGQIMELKSGVQQRLFENLFLEMKSLMTGDGVPCIDLIQEVNMSSSYSSTASYTVQLTTWPDEEGNVYVVNLGNCVDSPDEEQQMIHRKLRSFLLIWDKLHYLSENERTAIEKRIKHRINGGSIDVTAPEQPHYSPDLE